MSTGEWHGQYEPPEPRWGPERPLAERITKVGRWRRVDPLRRGGVWSRWKWLTLVGYLGFMGGVFAKAYRDHGGLDLDSLK